MTAALRRNLEQQGVETYLHPLYLAFEGPGADLSPGQRIKVAHAYRSHTPSPRLMGHDDAYRLADKLIADVYAPPRKT